jgi:hypothetical protein
VSGANYEYCPGCDMKALYVGEEDVGDVVVFHADCHRQLIASAVATEFTRIRHLAADKGAVYRTGLKGSRHFAPFADLMDVMT